MVILGFGWHTGLDGTVIHYLMRALLCRQVCPNWQRPHGDIQWFGLTATGIYEILGSMHQ